MTPEVQRAAIGQFVTAMKPIPQSFAKLAKATQGVHFALLDYVTEVNRDEQAPVSWEVERERFMRSLPSYDPRND